MLNHRNTEATGVTIGLIISMVGSSMILLPFLSNIDMMTGGYALQFIGLLVLITGLVTLWFYRARAAAFDHILAGENVLAHWKLDQTQVQKHAAAELAETNENNRLLFGITAILFVVIGIPILVVPMWEDLMFWRDPIAWVVIVGYFAIVPLLALFAWGVPRLAYQRAIRDGANVYIGKEGLFVNGAFHTWKQPLTDLRNVRFNRQTKSPALEFDIRTLTRLGVTYFKTYTVRVPVPVGQEEQAERVARFFGTPTSK
jgi:hypothetical protein